MKTATSRSTGDRKAARAAPLKKAASSKTSSNAVPSNKAASNKAAATRAASVKAAASEAASAKASSARTPSARAPSARAPSARTSSARRGTAVPETPGNAGLQRSASNDAAHEVAAATHSPPAGEDAAYGFPVDLFQPGAVAPWKLDQQKLLELQNDYVSQASQLLSRFAAGQPPELADRRFSSQPWREQPQFSWQAAWYLLNSQYLQKTAELIEADRKTRDRIRFMTQQWVDACSPANFLASNPEAQAKLISTGGESLRLGINNLLEDMRQGRISQTDLKAFEVGRNVGTSKGSVVFENELVQLIQYDPTTEKVGSRPLLVIPPSINKFYILDLQPENSFIGHAVAEGNTVFLVSWRNVKQPQSKMTWDDYLQLGVVDTIEVVQKITGQKTLNTLGFCVGGTILCTALAALAARGERPAASLTLLTTLLDFADTGVLGIFIDEMHVALREQTIGGGGLMAGGELATTFASLRPNDLVWNYVVNNYLKGESPPPFDLLYWNADSSNLPGPMFCWYLRHMYLQNDLREPGSLTCLGERISLRDIDVPSYILCTSEDHIVPWQGAFESAKALGGESRFVVGASGHIAGVINPPVKKKRSFRTGAEIHGLQAEEWLARSEEQRGSWWTDWSSWLAPFQGPKVPAPEKPGGNGYEAIEPAPGRYVKEKAV